MAHPQLDKPRTRRDNRGMKTRFLAVAHRARALFQDHQDGLLVAGRVGLSATLAYLVATLQHMPETYWPVMSAVIVARGGAKGASGSAGDRLIGTLAGAAVGLVASQMHRFGIPDWALLFLAMAPMAFLSADNTAFRAAPMAAMIVLSAAGSGKVGHGGAAFGLGVAALRVLDVGLGTVVALFVSYVVLPSNAMAALRKNAAALMMPMANLLSTGTRPDDAEAKDKFTRLGAKTRKEMRELTIAARQIKAKGDEESLPLQFTQALSRAHGAIVFINRALSGAPVPDAVTAALRPFVRDARARFGAIHHLLAEGQPAGAGAELDASVASASARLEKLPGGGKAHLEALPFLLQSLRDDLNDLAATAAAISGPGKMRAAADGESALATQK
jgi:uncharacterized membrane protein YccC